MTTARTPPPWPAHLPRPAGLRAVARPRADGTTDWQWYDRETGARLPDPSDPGFTGALTVIRRRRLGPEPGDGTVSEAVEAWLRSPEFRAKRPRTQQMRNLYIKPLRKAEMRLTALRRSTILDWRDTVAESRGPAAANMFLKTVRAFLGWCVDRDRIDHNVALRAPVLPEGTLTTWTEAEAHHAMKVFTEPVRRAIVLAYYTGQRRGDLLAMTRNQIDLAAGRIRLTQEKARGAPGEKPVLTLPIPAPLRLELEQWARAPLGSGKQPTALTILTTETGRPWGREYLSQQVKAEVLKAGMRPSLTIHGLRKLRAASLAESGATTKEIAAVTGHRTLAMIAHYTEAADQERLAVAAFHRLTPKSTRKKS